MTPRQRKNAAQEELMAFMMNAILAEQESYAGTDNDLVKEMQKQARRVAKLFHYTHYVGLGKIT